MSTPTERADRFVQDLFKRKLQPQQIAPAEAPPPRSVHAQLEELRKDSRKNMRKVRSLD